MPSTPQYTLFKNGNFFRILRLVLDFIILTTLLRACPLIGFLEI